MRDSVIDIDGTRLVVTSGVFRLARIFDEDWLPVRELPDPLRILSALSGIRPSVDVFTFQQRFPDVSPQFDFQRLMMNLSVVAITCYEDWFNAMVDRSVRKNVRRSERDGISVVETDFDDDFVTGVSKIYNETAFRQGRRFKHFGKPLDRVRMENSSYLDRSVLLGAYSGGELVGFAKIVVDTQVASIMQLLAMNKYAASRPTNALIAAAVRTCASRGIRYLIYGAHVYGNKNESSLKDFKENNGFRQIDYPQYYVPLTRLGRIGLAAGLHQSWSVRLPPAVISSLWQARAWYYGLRRDLSR